MKYKNKYDIGDRACVLFANDVVDMLKVLSRDTWIKYIPEKFTELLNDNFVASLKSVDLASAVYFDLNDKFKNDKEMIKRTIKSYQAHYRIDEINIKTRPLTKKRKG